MNRRYAVAFVAGTVVVGAGALLASCRAAPPPRTPPDVVVISIDTLRADRLGSYGARDASTPVLDDLARRGARFTDVLAPAPLTLPSHASLFTGVTPLRHGVHDNVGFALGSALPTLAERFRNAGYETQAFVSGLPLQQRAGLGRGFDGYDDRLTRGDDEARPAPVERRADETVAAVDQWLGQHPAFGPRPLFLWVHLFDPHAPYDPPEPFKTRFRDRPYDGEIAFADSQIGVLLDRVSRARAGRPSVVSVTADHGEGLGEHSEPTHGLLVYNSTIRVPLLIAGEGVPRARVINNPVRVIDLALTLLDVAGLPPLDHTDGVSLRASFAGVVAAQPAYVESLFGRLCCGWAPLRAWRDGKWMYIDAPRPELYDVAADPGQLHNLAAEQASQAAALKQALTAAVARASGAASSASPSTATRARLESLGYVSAAGGVPPSLRDPKDMANLSARLGRAIETEAADPRAAEQVFREILRTDAENPLARRHLGMALVRQGKAAEATSVLRALAAAGDDSVDTLMLLANLALERNDLGEARARLEIINARDAADAEAAFKLGVIAARSREFDRAVALFMTVVNHEPSNVDALVDLGGALIETGRAAEAAAYFQRAIDRGAEGTLAWNGLAFAKRQAGDRSGAIEALRHSLAIQPNQPRIAAALDEMLRQ